MVVLRRDENVGIEITDLRRPRFGVRLAVLPHYGRHRLVEERQAEVLNVHEFEFGVGSFFCDFADPFGHGLAVSPGSCTSDDDGDSKCSHNFDIVRWIGV